MTRYRLAVDTGGTFSDLVYLSEDTGAVSIAKVPSTPDDPSRAILQGIETLIARGIPAGAIGFFCHGTTVGTNALLEGKGARTGLLVTEGFRGIYEVAEQCRPYGPAIFDVMYDRPDMLVPQSRTGEVGERVDSRGDVLRALDEGALRTTLRDLEAQRVESMAVCLLFSFLNPAHELRVREIVLEEMPQCRLSLSSEVVPQIREYYRLSTTVVNAYLQPILARYLAQLGQSLAESGMTTRQKYVMQSNGGMSTFDTTGCRAVTTVLSGPAGGVTAGARAARTTGWRNIITFDMGGTSCDVALIRDGIPFVATGGAIEGRHLAVPMMDINTVSAGGGTIARVDRLGALEVGPQSAGALPGPACYGRGGDDPTITDCNLVLGYLSADTALAGHVRLDVEKAREAVERRLAQPLGMTAIGAAAGVIRVIDVKMAEAIKAISTMRGHDLREFVLLAFGGAGPLHATRIARDLGMAGVVVPPYPGVYSAIGLLMSDVKHDYVHSKMSPLDTLTAGEVTRMFEGMEDRAREELRGDGFADEEQRIERELDMRYAGQGYEVTLACPSGTLPQDALADLRRSFDARHHTLFGHMAPDEPVELVSYRVRGVGVVPGVELPRFTPTGKTLEDARRATRQVWFDGTAVECPVYQREELDVGLTITGPAVLDQLDCTTVLGPGPAARVDEWKNLIVTMNA